MAFAAGTRLGPYVLEALIGQGGMGEVYRAHDARLNRTVAIKVLAPDAATPERLERFEGEARAASALNHPNILTIHDVGREGDTAYLAMEWVEGHTLRQLLDGPIPLRRVLLLAQQIAEGLARAHAAGVVHRDLKPENVMITADGIAKIVDFGLAKLAPATTSAAGQQAQTVTALRATDPGMVMGTAGYMSPEQASGRSVDYRSDQFALGLLMYELATGTRPFKRATTAQTLAATIEDDPAPIESLNPAVPPHLAAIVSRCLAKDPSDRYDSTRDLARDLKSITEPSSRATAVARPAITRRTGVRAALIVGLVAIAAAATLSIWQTPAAPISSEPDGPLLAVRPFSSLSVDPQHAYFAAGMTEEIRSQLSQVSSLRLLSRNGLDNYKDEIARGVRELGIRHLVDGSVRVEGDRARVSAELIDASTQQTLWSQQYDRQLADILGVQAEVAIHIAQALRTTISPREQQRLERRPTQNAEAYALYLQSQQLVPLTDRDKNVAAMELLRKTLALDPSFAMARARLGYRLVFMGLFDSESYVDRGIAEAEEALRVDPDLPYGHFVLGTAYGTKGADAPAKQAFLRALELDPNNVVAMNNFSVHETAYGRLDEGLYWGRRGFALSGKIHNDYYHVSVPLGAIRADDVHRRWLLDAERRFPGFYRVQIMLSLLDLSQRRIEDAVRRTEALTARQGHNDEVKHHHAYMAYFTDAPDLEARLRALLPQSDESFSSASESVRIRYAYVLGRRGDAAQAKGLVDEAERAVRDKVNAGNGRPDLRVELALGAALRNDRAAALDWLERAYDAGLRDYAMLEFDPILAPLRNDAQFTAVIEEMKRDVEAQRLRADERGLLDMDALLVPGK